MKPTAGNRKCCLKLKLGNVLTLTGFCHGRRPSLFRLGILLLVGDYPIRTLVLYQKDFGWTAFLEVEPRCVEVALAEGLCNLGGGNHLN
jgi:hypothetical protein